MRNLKKFLALVLAMVMAFSLMLSASAASDTYDKYPDKDSITDTFKEGVQVLSGLDVMAGDDKGFRPGDTITRAEAAVVIYRVATGDVANAQTDLYKDYATFKDMSHDDWFAGYVGFCQNAGYIKGTTPTTFSPYLPVTGYEMLAMLLRVVGYGKNNEFVGNTWQVNVAALAESLHVTDTVKEANFSSTLNRGARRDVVAELTFRTMTMVPTVTYSTALQYNDRDMLLSSSMKNPTLGQKIFGLFMDDTVSAIDDWGRPGYYWVKNGVQALDANNARLYDARTLLPIYTNKTGATSKANAVATIKDEPIKVYTTAKTECDIIHENPDWSGDKSQTISSWYVNGVKNTPSATNLLTSGQDGVDNNTIEALGTNVVMGAQGRILEIYDMSLGGKRVSNPTGGNGTAAETDTRIVEIDTYLGRVNKVTAAGEDKNGHKVPATIDVQVYGASNSGSDIYTQWHHNLSANHNSHTTWDFDGVEAEGFTVGQYVLVYINQNVAASDAAVHDARNFVTNKYKIANGQTVTEGQDDIVAAPIKNGGFVYNWVDGKLDQPDTTVVGQTTYEDAAKFCCNWRQNNIPYSVATDRYDNAIGLVNFTQYLAIEGIEWIHDGALYGGKAVADVVLADGSKVEDVTIKDLNNLAMNNYGGRDGNGIISSAGVSDYFMNNGEYYQHIYSYAVNEDGSYSLSADCGSVTVTTGTTNTNKAYTVWGDTSGTKDNGPMTAAQHGHTTDSHNPVGNVTIGQNPSELYNAVITQGEATIYGNGTVYGGGAADANVYTATDNTVFALLNADNYTYTVYVGKSNVPTVHGATLCIQRGEDGYAAFVLVKDYRLAGNTFAGYIGDITRDTGKMIGSVNYDGIEVYREGESTPTVVYVNPAAGFFSSDTGTTTNYSTHGEGFYQISVDNNNVVTSVQELITDGNDLAVKSYDNGAIKTGVSDLVWARRLVTNAPSGTSVKTNGYTGTTVNPIVYNGYTANLTGSGNTDTVSTGAWSPRDFNITSSTKIVVVNKTDLTNNSFTSMSAGTEADITDNSIIYVAYDVNNTSASLVAANIYNAAYIYVIKLPNNYKLADKHTTASGANAEDWRYNNYGTQMINQTPDCYEALITTGDVANVIKSQQEALRLAVANAKELKLSELTPNSSNEYNIKVYSATSTSSGDPLVIKVFNDAATITLSNLERLAGSAVALNNDPGFGSAVQMVSRLASGNYIVIAKANATGAVQAANVSDADDTWVAGTENILTHFEVFKLVP